MTDGVAMLKRKEGDIERKDARTEVSSGWWRGVWSDGRLNTHPERRAQVRIPSKLEARFFIGNTVYAGTITNLSERGMFISTDLRLPVHYRLDVLVRIKGRVLKIPATIRRSVKPESHRLMHSKDGMGIELSCLPEAYIEYVKSLRPAA